MSWKCKHCCEDFDGFTTSQKANHSKYCPKRPDLAEAKSKLFAKGRGSPQGWNRGLTKETDDRIAKQAKSFSESYKEGKHKPYDNYISPEGMERLREFGRTRAHKFRKRGIVEHTKPDGSKVMLDSSWEKIVAEKLDEAGIAWIRPVEPIIWGDGRNYYPDFYLPDIGVYLEPKNEGCMIMQKEKVDWLKANREDVIFLTSEKECQSVLDHIVRV